MKFKVGDEVKYTGVITELKNKIGVIAETYEGNGADVVFDNNQYWFITGRDVERYLELVQKNVNSDKKDLIRNLINKYLSDNETSIREELFLKRFQDYCFEKLGDE